ncbi:MAG: nickel pincer cofactor biosynthesis protein LarB [Candidatus Saganbacteria bacterium]|nr:nickel pincer cofactor biosynthesis protein LarB [Candidatus Saganbacteria bacterium]
MDKNRIENILRGVRSGKIQVNEAFSQLKSLPYEDIGFAKIDHHRSIRKGFPEVVFCQGKTRQQISAILKKLLAKNKAILATRADKAVFDHVKREIPAAKYHEMARIITITKTKEAKNKKGKGYIAVITAGTADMPVAEEACVTAEFLGSNVKRTYDVGVAGIHRLVSNMKDILKARVVIVAAGMEGALASVVAGLVEAPVIAVPTSVGYGASFKGLAALLAMLNSCAPGVAVVNIDNGFGAGCLAHTIMNSTAKK